MKTYYVLPCRATSMKEHFYSIQNCFLDSVHTLQSIFYQVSKSVHHMELLHEARHYHHHHDHGRDDDDDRGHDHDHGITC